MKLNFGNKILILLHWLCSLIICVAFALCLIVPDLQANLISRAEGVLGALGAKIAGGALLALYLALSVATLLTLIRRKKRVERGFITVGPEEKGRVRIAVSAVEQMVRQSVRNIDGITDMRVDIEGLDDAIVISVNAVVASGAHVPTITAGMQRAIIQFVEVNCGVAVQSVEITINSVSGKAEASRRRLLGRGKAQSDSAAPAFSTELPVNNESQDPVRTPPDGANAGEGATGVGGQAPQAANDDPGAKESGFDPDKPYESEFAKDYAAMMAREDAAQTKSTDTNPTED